MGKVVGPKMSNPPLQTGQKQPVGSDKKNNCGQTETQTVTGKIGRKGEYPSSMAKRPQQPLKEESIYQSKGRTAQRNPPVPQNKDLKSAMRDANLGMETPDDGSYIEDHFIESVEKTPIQETKNNKSNNAEIASLKKQIQELTAREQKYTAKIAELQQNLDKLGKTEQKMQRMQKEHREALAESKQLTTRLAEKE